MTDHGFQRWQLADSNAIAPIFPPGKRRGIYVLEFADGTLYVGQATNVLRRYRSHYHGSSHHSAWQDIVALRFKEVPSGDLDGPERAEIQRLLREGHNLRNRQFNLFSKTPAPLDQVVAVREQEHWVNGGTPAENVEFSKASLGRASGSKFAAWVAKNPARVTVYDLILEDLSFVLQNLIPAAVETEGDFWTVSDFPSTAGGRFATLNTGKIEFLYFPRKPLKHLFDSHEFWSRDVLEGYVGIINVDYIDPSIDDDEFSKIVISEHPDWHVNCLVKYNDHLVTEQIVYPIGHLKEFLEGFEEFLAAARDFALVQMRYGNSNLFRQFHSSTLVTEIYEKIASRR